MDPREKQRKDEKPELLAEQNPTNEHAHALLHFFRTCLFSPSVAVVAAAAALPLRRDPSAELAPAAAAMYEEGPSRGPRRLGGLARAL